MALSNIVLFLKLYFTPQDTVFGKIQFCTDDLRVVKEVLFLSKEYLDRNKNILSIFREQSTPDLSSVSCQGNTMLSKHDVFVV
jgi:hypothetical protein